MYGLHKTCMHVDIDNTSNSPMRRKKINMQYGKLHFAPYTSPQTSNRESKPYTSNQY